MFLSHIPFSTSYGDRVIFLRSQDLERVVIVKDTPQFSGSDLTQKQFYLDMIKCLGKNAGSYSKKGIESLQRESTYILKDASELGAIINNANALFENKKPKGIIKIIYTLASIAQSAEKQFILVGNSSIFEYAKVVRDYQGSFPFPSDRNWILARMTVLNDYKLSILS
jgi:hypothetical protein